MALKIFGTKQKGTSENTMEYQEKLKECEWRFNIGSPKLLLKDLKSILKEFY